MHWCFVLLQNLEKCMALQKKCLSGVTHQKYRLNVIKKLMKEVSKTPVLCM